MQQTKQYNIRRYLVLQKSKLERFQQKSIDKMIIQQNPSQQNNSNLFNKEEFLKLLNENEQLKQLLNNKFQEYDKMLSIIIELTQQLEQELIKRVDQIDCFINQIDIQDKKIKQQKERIINLQLRKKDYKNKFQDLFQKNELLQIRTYLIQLRLRDLQEQSRFSQYQNQYIDVDNMNYEQLLQLGEQIGTVENGIAKEDIKRIEKRIIQQNDNIEGVCPVCQCNMEIGEKYRQLGCNHYYHAKCIKVWLLQHKNCPVCKQTVIIDI